MFGTYYSQMNYDTLSTKPWNIMNLHMNQAAAHLQTWPNFFQTQSYSFDNYIPYSNAYSNFYLTDPMYTIRQQSWGTPAWNNNMWNSGWNPWGMNLGNTSSSSSSSTDPEDIKYKEKYNKLLSLVKQLEKYEYLSNDEKRTLSAAIKDTKGTNEEKYDKLLKAYKSISKSKVKEFLVDGGQNLAVIDPNSSEGKNKAENNFYYQLTQTGYEYKNKAMDKEVENFYNSLENELDKNTGKAQKAADVINKLDSSNILDFISSYNTNHTDATLFEHIKDNWSKVGGEMKSTVSADIINPLANALIAKAQEVRDYLNEDSQDAVTEAIKELESAKSKSKTSLDSNFPSAFNRLYLLTRLGATAKVTNDAVAYYGEVDSEVFNNKLFNDKVVKDLIEEGFDETAIEDAKVELNEKEASRTSKTSKSDESDEADDVDSAEDKEAREQKRAERKERKEKAKEEASADARSNGISLNSYLSGWSFDNECSIAANNILADVNKDNVMALLDGYYVSAGKLGATEGLLEKLDDEWDGGTITMENKKNLVTSLLAVAEDVGLKNSPNYIKIKSIMTKYESGHSCENATTFNNGGGDRIINGEGLKYALGFGTAGAATGATAAALCVSSGSVGWIVGGAALLGAAAWVCADKVTDNEVIDKCMEALFNEIKSKKVN